MTKISGTIFLIAISFNILQAQSFQFKMIERSGSHLPVLSLNSEAESCGYAEHWTVFWITAHCLNAAARFKEMGVAL